MISKLINFALSYNLSRQVPAIVLINQSSSKLKSKAIKCKEADNWALPGDPLTTDEFKKGIKEAEKGPFYTIEDSKKIIAEWRKQRNSR